MDPHSQTEDTQDSREILEGQLRECFGRVAYSHKTQEKCADILQTRLARLKLWQIILSAATTGGFVAVVFGVGQAGAAFGVIVSSALFGLAAYNKNYDLGTLAQKHRQAATELWLIRERYLSLTVDLRMREKPIERLQEERDTLLEELHSVYSGAPSTNIRAYQQARKALQDSEELTFSDAEIDAMLPRELKRVNKGNS